MSALSVYASGGCWDVDGGMTGNGGAEGITGRIMLHFAERGVGWVTGKIAQGVSFIKMPS